jgi:hypothetical protein
LFCFILIEKIKNLYNKQKILCLEYAFYYIKKIYDILPNSMEKKVSIKDDDRNNHRNNNNNDSVCGVCGGDFCGDDVCDGDVCGDDVCGGVYACDD